MTERLLQFIWKMQYFNPTGLQTQDGETILILHPGIWNVHQGPDFKDAKIRIGSTIWAGNIELHLKSSDWSLHKHSEDKNYDNIILHVVWEYDSVARNGSGLLIPTVALQDRVSKLLLQRYEDLMKAPWNIPCCQCMLQVDRLVWTSWKDRLLIERLTRKSKSIHQNLAECSTHWEEVFWWTIARNFGMHQNSETFEAIARSLPLKILTKHKPQIHQLEAFLLGQGGLLENQIHDKYGRLLQKEYQFLRKKYRLEPVHSPIHFLRMRPGNFPTIRLAQLAMLIHQSVHLFSKIRDAHSLIEVKQLFSFTANDYWHYHYTIDEPSAFKLKTLGKQMIESIIINTVVPVLFAYGTLNKAESDIHRAMHWLESLHAESNTVINEWNKIGIPCRNAFDSQALLELYHSYCEKKKCLDCAIGNALLKYR